MVQRILTQRSWNTDLAQVVQQDPDTVVQQDPDTEILHKWSYRVLTQAVQRTLIQRSCTSGPTGSWYKWSKRILIQRSWARSCTSATTYRDLAQVVLQDPNTSGPKDPDTEILYKWSYKILIQVVQNACTSGWKGSWYGSFKSILIQRSCKSGPTGPWYKWSKRPDTEILHKCPHNRDLVQVLLQDPDTSGPKDPHTEILKHRSCTSCPTGSWYSGLKDPHTEILSEILH